jgi:hypothetical protein
MNDFRYETFLCNGLPTCCLILREIYKYYFDNLETNNTIKDITTKNTPVNDDLMLS